MPDSGALVLAALAMGLLPGFEPRYAVPLLYAALGPLGVVLAAIEALLLAAALTLLVDRLLSLAEALASRSRLLSRLYGAFEARRRRVASRLSRVGAVGLAAFVAVPLPVTGMYTGAAVALLMGLSGARLYAALASGGLASVVLVAAGVEAVRLLGLG